MQTGHVVHRVTKDPLKARSVINSRLPSSLTCVLSSQTYYLLYVYCIGLPVDCFPAVRWLENAMHHLKLEYMSHNSTMNPPASGRYEVRRFRQILWRQVMFGPEQIQF